jgi:hypothetical protein
MAGTTIEQAMDYTDYADLARISQNINAGLLFSCEGSSTGRARF